jgi:hypothetical protein
MLVGPVAVMVDGKVQAPVRGDFRVAPSTPEPMQAPDVEASPAPRREPRSRPSAHEADSGHQRDQGGPGVEQEPEARAAWDLGASLQGRYGNPPLSETPSASTDLVEEAATLPLERCGDSGEAASTSITEVS